MRRWPLRGPKSQAPGLRAKARYPRLEAFGLGVLLILCDEAELPAVFGSDLLVDLYGVVFLVV